MSEFDKLFHIRKDLNNRIVPLCPVFDAEGKWHAWLDRGKDLQEISIIEPVESTYFAQKPVSEKDVYFDFMNFMHQRGTREDAACTNINNRYVLHTKKLSRGKFSRHKNLSGFSRTKIHQNRWLTKEEV